MNESEHIDFNALMLEVTRYLAAVDVFRAEHCEPTWLPERASVPTANARAKGRSARVQQAH